MSQGQQAPGRMGGLDSLKGVCVVMVVLIHAAPEAEGWYQNHVVAGAFRLAVPCFLAVTGFLAGHKDTQRPRFGAYFRIFLRLHLIYGAFYWLVSAGSSGASETITLKSALMHFGQAAYAGQFYFVVLLQVFFAAAFLLPQRFWRSGWCVLASAGALVLGLGLLDATPSIVAAYSLPRWTGRLLGTPNAIWLWLYYFTLGAFLADHERAGKTFVHRLAATRPVLLVSAGLVLATAAVPAIPEWGSWTVYPYARVYVLLSATLVILCLPALATLPAPAALHRIGRDSFGVWVFNPAILILLFQLFGRPTAAWTSWIYAAVTVALAIPLTGWIRRRVPLMLP